MWLQKTGIWKWTFFQDWPKTLLQSTCREVPLFPATALTSRALLASIHIQTCHSDCPSKLPFKIVTITTSLWLSHGICKQDIALDQRGRYPIWSWVWPVLSRKLLILSRLVLWSQRTAYNMSPKTRLSIPTKRMLKKRQIDLILTSLSDHST